MADDQRPSEVARQQARVRGRNDAGYVRGRRDPAELRILCECGRYACAAELTVNTEVYRAVRGKPGQFIVATGHHGHALDRLVRQLGGLTIVESTYVGEVTASGD